MTSKDIVTFIKKSPLVTACAVISIGLIAGLFLTKDDIPETETALADKTTEADRYALNKKNAEKLQEQFDALVAANKTIDGRMLRASQLGVNAQYFFKLESETGVKLVNDPRQTTPANVAKPAKGSYVSVGFAVSAQGTLNQLLDFLRALENGEHYCRILNATLVGNQQKRSGPLTLNLTLELLGTP